MALTAYAQSAALGSPLSYNLFSDYVAAGATRTTTLTTTTEPVSLQIYSARTTLPQAVSNSVALGVNAFDAAHDLVIGALAFDNAAVTVTSTDRSGGTSLMVTTNGTPTSEGSTATLPSPASQVAVQYAGQPLAKVSFTASGAAPLQQSPASAIAFNPAITHVVIIVQENRGFDNLFNGYPGADTVSSGQTSTGLTIPLLPQSMVTYYDPGHSHGAFLTSYNNGLMNGFDNDFVNCVQCTPPPYSSYFYVPQQYVEPYWQMAQAYSISDRMFASNEGSSFPAHLYLIAASAVTQPGGSLYVMDGAQSPRIRGDYGGCDAPADVLAPLINPLTNDQTQKAFPCFDPQTIFDSLDAIGATWKYYQATSGEGLWNAPDAVSHIRYGPDYQNVSIPNSNIISDIEAGSLPNVSWVIPTAAESDHARATDGSGPAWVASVVNAVGQSKYWNSTAIFVTWDDWGGWYDHVAPPVYNYYELGFRVPLLTISPYAKAGYVSHVTHEFGSILRFTEETFGLPSLGYADARADDLSDTFNFAQKPIVFQTIPAARVPEADKHDTRPIDDE